MPEPFALVLGSEIGSWPANPESTVPLTCQWITQMWSKSEPAEMFFIVQGSAAADLPAIALAQRSAHRRVAGYLLIDAEAPPSRDAWPDAPVVAFTSDVDARSVSLRGWPVRTFTTTEELESLLAQEMHMLLG